MENFVLWHLLYWMPGFLDSLWWKGLLLPLPLSQRKDGSILLLLHRAR